jgi:hypothetical protein
VVAKASLKEGKDLQTALIADEAIVSPPEKVAALSIGSGVFFAHDEYDISR